MELRPSFQSEWEWGWLAPLLFHLPTDLPPEIRTFLAEPLEQIRLPEAETYLVEKLANLRTTRIGIRFERVQESLFRFHPGTESLRAGIVIPGRTEIDLLHRIRALPDTHIHWEVAVKYYIAVDEGGSTDPDRWIGPGQKDSLGNKTRTIYGRQLSILRDAEVRRTIGIPDNHAVVPLPKIHGILFSPFRTPFSSTRLPAQISENSSRGVWLNHGSLREFLEPYPGDGDDWNVRWLRDRRDWIRALHLTGPDPDVEMPLKSFFKSYLETAIQSHFRDVGEPIQCALFKRISGASSELRFFIVSDDWHSTVDAALETMRAKSRIS